MMAKLNKPVDRKAWVLSPYMVNANYDPPTNKFVLLAGILNKPFFDIHASYAENYGAIGMVIGHEIGHGFDDQGGKFDDKGNFVNWWSKEDKIAFNKIRSRLIAQANRHKPLPNIHLNGELTVGEIIGDLNGVEIAFRAYVKLAKKKGVDTIENRKKFFKQLAIIYRIKKRKEAMIQALKTDPHPDAEYRVDGTLKNIYTFHELFNTKPGDKMYREPSKRVKLW